jgi:hypothetical protein
MKKTFVTTLLLSVMLYSATALAFVVRCYNEDSKTYQATFVCKGNITVPVEISQGTTSLSTQNSGPCELRLGGSSVVLNEGDNVAVKDGAVQKR